MANSLTSQCWVIDTPSAAILYKGWIKVASIVISDQLVAGDQTIIQDQNGALVVDAKAEGPNKIQSFGPRYIQGLIVPTLQSGKITIYIA